MPEKLTLFQYPVDEAPYELALTLGRSLPAQKNDLPCQYYWKEMLQLGRIVDTNGNEHNVTSEYLDQVASDFQKAKAKGHEPYLPFQYHPTPKPNTPTDRTKVKTENKGFLVDVMRRKDSLYGLHQFIGTEDDIKKTVATNKSSIGILKNVRASDGEVYQTFIDHNSILPDPQLDGLGDFIPVNSGNTLFLAASRGAVVEQVVLKRAEEQGDSTMQALTADHVAKIKTLVGLKDPKVAAGVTDSNAIDLLLGFAQDPPKAGEAILLSREQLEVAKKATGKAELTSEQAAVALLDHLKTVEDKNLTLSRDLDTATKAKKDADDLLLSRTPVTLDDDTAHERALRVDMGLEQLTLSGYTPAFVNDLKPILVGPENKYDSLMLSRNSTDKNVDIRAMQIVNVLKKHKEDTAPALGTVAVNKEQHLLLSRRLAEGDAAPSNIGELVGEAYNDKATPGTK